MHLVKQNAATVDRTCGAMDNASDYGSEDSRFESWQVRDFSSNTRAPHTPKKINVTGNLALTLNMGRI